MRSAIVGVDHALPEMALTRQCADVSKLMFHMRINGDVLDHDLLASFDGQLRASCGDLSEKSMTRIYNTRRTIFGILWDSNSMKQKD